MRRPVRLMLLLLPCALFVVAGCASMRSGVAGVEVVAERAGDSVQLDRSAGVLRLSVNSPSGIGRVRVMLDDDAARSGVVLRLRYEMQRPFATLEGLEVDGQRLNVTTVQQEGWLQLQLPAGTFHPAKQHQLQWVDAYRR